MAKIRLATVTTETSPPAGQLAVYAKTIDQSLYLREPSGTERVILDGSSPGAFGYRVENFTLSAGQAASKSITLSTAPTFPTKTLLQVDGAGASFYGLDFEVSGAVVSWNGLRLDGLLESGDVVQVVFIV